MTTDIKIQFFETFGIEPKHNDGCEISDRYWANEENADKYITFDNYMNTFCPESDSGACFATCPFAYCKEEYPQITDTQYLQLVCWVNERRIFQNFDVNGLKEYVLKELCTMVVTEQFKQQVQALFKEG